MPDGGRLVQAEKLALKLAGTDVFYRPEGVAEISQAVKAGFVTGIRNAFSGVTQNQFRPLNPFG